jgi:hypothetical protein
MAVENYMALVESERLALVYWRGASSAGLMPRACAKGVQPEAAFGATVHLLGVGVAAFLGVQEHHRAERSDVAEPHPEPMVATMTVSQHPIIVLLPRW